MSKGVYAGIGGLARKAKRMYTGVDGVARKVKKAYVGVNGKARLFWSGSSLQTGEAIVAGAAYTSGVVDGIYKLSADGTLTMLTGTPVIDESPVYIRKMCVLDNVLVASLATSTVFCTDIENPVFSEDNCVVIDSAYTKMSQLFVFRGRFFANVYYTDSGYVYHRLYYSSSGLAWTLCGEWTVRPNNSDVYLSNSEQYSLFFIVDDALDEISAIGKRYDGSYFYDFFLSPSAEDGTAWANAATYIKRNGNQYTMAYNFLKKYNDVYYWRNPSTLYQLLYGSDYSNGNYTAVTCNPASGSTSMSPSFLNTSSSGENSNLAGADGVLYLPMRISGQSSSSGPGFGEVRLVKVDLAKKSLIGIANGFAYASSCAVAHGAVCSTQGGNALFSEGVLKYPTSSAHMVGGLYLVDGDTTSASTATTVSDSNGYWIIAKI